MCRKPAHLDAPPPLLSSSAGRLAETTCQGELASDGCREGADQLQGQPQASLVPHGLQGEGKPGKPSSSTQSLLPLGLSVFVSIGIYLCFPPTAPRVIESKEDILYVLKRSSKNNLADFFHV